MTEEQKDMTEAEAALWREVSEMNEESPESWLCFVNCGHKMETAKALFDRGLIHCQMQMGMPVCQVRPQIEDSCGCVFCDIGLIPMHLNKGYTHVATNGGRDAPCTNPNRK